MRSLALPNDPPETITNVEDNRLKIAKVYVLLHVKVKE